MPIYEYECATCQRVHDVVQKFSDAPLTDCPVCKGPVQKLISRSSFALKGSGWYTTDYKRAGSAKKSDSTAETSVAPKADAAKPEAAARTETAKPEKKPEKKES